RLRYEPTSREAITMRSLPSDMTLPAARCTLAKLVTRAAPDGSALHELNLDLMNEGGGVLKFRLPSGKLLQALAEGKEVEVEAMSSEGAGWYVAQLPNERRQLQVQFTFSTPPQTARLRPFAQWQFTLPELSLPVAEREWQVWIAP